MQNFTALLRKQGYRKDVSAGDSLFEELQYISKRFAEDKELKNQLEGETESGFIEGEIAIKTSKK